MAGAEQAAGDEPRRSAVAKAAVVVVNYRSDRLARSCLESVGVKCVRTDMEVVVVDNGSHDGGVERLRDAFPKATVLSLSQNLGFAAGVNAGMRATQADVVILLNPDTEAMASALDLLVERLREHPRTGVAAPLLEHENGSLQPNAYRRFPGLFTLFVELCIPVGYVLAHVSRLHPYAMSSTAMLAGERPAHVYGAALAIRRQAYEDAGPFDEGFFLYLEETEWQSRVAAAGWDIELVPHARVRHLVRGGGEASLAPSPHFVTSALRYLSLRGVSGPLARALLTLALACSWLTLLGISALPSKRTHARIQARAYGGLLWIALRGGPVEDLRHANA